jgi:hypothetical protein
MFILSLFFSCPVQDAYFDVRDLILCSAVLRSPCEAHFDAPENVRMKLARIYFYLSTATSYYVTSLSPALMIVALKLSWLPLY